MPLKIAEIKVNGYERVIHATNITTKLDCIIAVHNTKLGPGLGGVRSWIYKNFEEQKADVLKLAEAMTFKNSVCGINFGGGKAALNLAGVNKTPELYKSYAEVVEKLNGTYLTAGDVGTFKEDLINCSKVTKYVYGINVETSAPTSRGIYNSIKSVCKFVYGKDELNDIHVAISGIGKVGGKLAKLLFKSGCMITASNINSELINDLKKEIILQEVDPEKLYKTQCNIISPCALGGSINTLTKNKLKCKIIAGAANNQLDSDETSQWLLKNDIVYCPDYLVNSGGVIAIACEINKSENTLDKQLSQIGNRLISVLKESSETNEITNSVAKRIALERIKH